MDCEISGTYFPDGKKRGFELYKGWKALNEDDRWTQDALTATDNGPLRTIPDPIGHGNFHTLDNLLNPEGVKILPRGVRKITHYPEGFYLLEDNNEDELIERGDVRGGFRARDYITRCNVVTDDGILVSEEWFDKIWPSGEGYFIITRNHKENLMDIHGKILLPYDVDQISEFIDGSACFVNDGEVFRVSGDGAVQHIRALELLSEDGQYFVDYNIGLTISNGEIDDSIVRDYIGHNNGGRYYLQIYSEEPIYRMNLVDLKGYHLLLKNWHERVLPCSLRGIKIARDGQTSKLVGIDCDQIGETFLDDITDFKFGHAIVRTVNGFGLIDRNGRIVHDGFTSVFYATDGLGAGRTITLDGDAHNSRESHSIYSFYLHEIHISNRIPGLLEKDEKWYIPDFNGGLSEVCYFPPSSI